MQIRDICNYLEALAPLAYQESYDNSGLIVGRPETEVSSILISLDCIERTVDEALQKGCNLIISHHPIVFTGLKRFNGANYIERTVEKALVNGVAIYAIHTNLDNMLKGGVNDHLSSLLGLKNKRILRPKLGDLLKLASYVPKDQAQKVLNALFAAGAGHIGNYTACSFSTEGFGTFKGNELSNPTVGLPGLEHTENELKIEVILPNHLQGKVYQALIETHPYEEVAYEFYPTTNLNQDVGAGMIGELPEAMNAERFLTHLKQSLDCNTIKYTPYAKKIKTVAVCGGSGSFLLQDALRQKADAFVTGDVKYHQFFDADSRLMYCDIGHYESEKNCIELLYDILTQKFTTFAVLKTEVDTNPIKYF